MWEFFQTQILGMAWLKTVITELAEKIGLSHESLWTHTIIFFFYDVIKITVLLCVLIFLISFIQTFFPPEKSKRIMGRFGGLR